MIIKLLHHAHILHQKTANECEPAEPDVSVCLDALGLIILGQGGQELIINPESIPELCKLLRKMKGLSEAS